MSLAVLIALLLIGFVRMSTEGVQVACSKRLAHRQNQKIEDLLAQGVPKDAICNLRYGYVTEEEIREYLKTGNFNPVLGFKGGRR